MYQLEVLQKTFIERRPFPAAWKFGIVKHNPRGANGVFEPDEIEKQDEPFGEGVGHTVPYSQEWLDYIKAINPITGYNWITTDESMYFNGHHSPDYGIPALGEHIISGGAFFASDYETPTHYHMISFDCYRTPESLGLNPSYNNWYFEPWRFCKLVAVDAGGSLIRVGKTDAYMPNLRRTDCWIHKNKVEIFPQGPDYNFRFGTDVYDGDQPLMICDRYDYRVRKFPTSWKIETLGVVPMQTPFSF